MRPDAQQRSRPIRHRKRAADGLIVPTVEAAAPTHATAAILRRACPSEHGKRLVACLIETPTALHELDGILQVGGVDAPFVAASDVLQSTGSPPGTPPGEERPRVVRDAIADAVRRIRTAGKVAGRLGFERAMERRARYGFR